MENIPDTPAFVEQTQIDAENFVNYIKKNWSHWVLTLSIALVGSWVGVYFARSASQDVRTQDELSKLQTEKADLQYTNKQFDLFRDKEAATDAKVDDLYKRVDAKFDAQTQIIIDAFKNSRK